MTGPLEGIRKIPYEGAVHISTLGNSHGRIDRAADYEMRGGRGCVNRCLCNVIRKINVTKIILLWELRNVS